MMSIAAMNWVWQLTLPPNKKIVLLSLADNADDNGVCWPSIAYIAKKCSISKRTTQRALSALIQLGLVYSKQEFKKDGSRKSNKYTLAMNVPMRQFDTPSNDIDDSTPRQPCRRGGVTGDVVNNNRTIIESSTRKNAPQKNINNLEYPKLTQNDLVKIKRLVDCLDRSIVHLSQKLLDELQGAINENVIQTTVVSFFKALIKSALNGTFKLYRGIAVAENRKASKKQVEQIRNQKQNIKLKSKDTSKKLDKVFLVIGHKRKK